MADSHSWQSASSNGGLAVAFSSFASTILPSDTNAKADIFIRDLTKGTTELVSQSTNGEWGNGHSMNPAISADGRYVAFESSASNLVAGDTNRTIDIFLRDRQSGTTERVSLGPNGEQGNNFSVRPSISHDGTRIAFESLSSNWFRGDYVSVDVFVRDVVALTTLRASPLPTSSGASEEAMISGDGKWVAFISERSLAASDQDDGREDVYRTNLATGELELLSDLPFEIGGFNPKTSPVISGDGRYTAFLSWEQSTINESQESVNEELCGCHYESWDILELYVHDNVTGQFTKGPAPVTPSSFLSSTHSLSISADGEVLALSTSANLVPEDINGVPDVYVWYLATGTVELASVDSNEVNGQTGALPSLAPDGSAVSFGGAVLTEYATSLYFEVFLRELRP